MSWIERCARSPAAPRLLLALLAFVGLLLAPSVQRATFPSVTAKTLHAEIRWPNAAATEVYAAICRRAEPTLRALDGVRRTACDARRGGAALTIGLDRGADAATVARAAQSALDALDDLPARAERAVLAPPPTPPDVVVAFAPGGAPDAIALEAASRRLAQAIAAETGAARWRLEGARRPALAVTLDPAALAAADLTAAEAADALDGALGTLAVGAANGLDGQAAVAVGGVEALAEAQIARPARPPARLGDVAWIEPRLDPTAPQGALLDGRPAALIALWRPAATDAILFSDRVSAAVMAHREAQAGVVVVDDAAALVRDRLATLQGNAIFGLGLVTAALWLVFGAPRALWIALGLPVSYLATLAAMNALGVTLDLMTMVGLIIVVGLVMDDSIVIAERVIAEQERDPDDPIGAALRGALDAAPAVTASFLTTAAVFGALLWLDGDMGEVLRATPLVMLIALTVSLVEAFLILPRHLAGATRGRGVFGPAPSAVAALDRLGRAAARWSAAATRRRWLTIGLAVGALAASLALLVGGVVPFAAFDPPEGDRVEARLALWPGGDARAAAEAAWGAATTAGLAPPVALIRLGENADAAAAPQTLATVTLTLPSAEARAAAAAWREAMPPLLAGDGVAPARVVEPMLGPAGRDVAFELSSADRDALAAAAARLAAALRRYRAVLHVDVDLDRVAPELMARPSAAAHAHGLGPAALARELAAALGPRTIGSIAAADDGPRLVVTLGTAGAERALGELPVRLPSGETAPLGALARLEAHAAPERLTTRDGVPSATVAADVDRTVGSPIEAALAALAQDWPQIAGDVEAEHGARVDIAPSGSLETLRDTQAGLARALAVGLIAVFIALALHFGSEREALAVMALIPFAAVGAILGHAVAGLAFSLPSMLGLAAVAGVAVNDGVLMIDTLKARRAAGLPMADAAGAAAEDRLRAVTLTSATTILGVLPLVLEPSRQAATLAPMAVSIAGGIAATTVMALLASPALFEAFGCDRAPDARRDDERRATRAGDEPTEALAASAATAHNATPNAATPPLEARAPRDPQRLPDLAEPQPSAAPRASTLSASTPPAV